MTDSSITAGHRLLEFRLNKYIMNIYNEISNLGL